jgi:hypothetical protein
MSISFKKTGERVCPCPPRRLMDYGAGWGNRTNRDGTAPPVLNIHHWGRKTVPDHSPPLGSLYIVECALRAVGLKLQRGKIVHAGLHRCSSNQRKYIANLVR